MNRQQYALAIILGVILFGGLGSNVESAATYTVINTDDSGLGSLREAITNADANPGADLIQFNIPGGGVQTINLLSPLPDITETVTIDGYTQPGSRKNTLADGNNAVLLIELNGINAGGVDPVSGNGVAGLRISGTTTSDVTVTGLVINRFSGAGIQIFGAAGGHVISGNFIGTNASGTAAGPGNGQYGIITNSGVAGTRIIIGGLTPASRNLISGNGSTGITGFNSTITTVIQGNYIGTNAAGTAAIGNGSSGISIRYGTSTVIGGTESGARNLISGNNGDGIYIDNGVFSGTTQGVSIEGNYIGTDFSGVTAVPNTASGVVLWGGGKHVQGVSIGGPIAGGGNVIAGNGGHGIQFQSSEVIGYAGSVSGNTVQGNSIGVNAYGLALPNGQSGITVYSAAASSPATQNSIGGPEQAANIIAHNTGSGVVISGSAATQNPILYNSIYSNGVLGIDLGGDGFTPNDPLDSDSGPNNLQNVPVLTAAQTACGYMNLRGTLDSAANTVYTVQLFANASCDGEGATYIGQTRVTTNGSGNGSFSVILPDAAAGNILTATATDPSGNTSEFSACVTGVAGFKFVVNSATDAVDVSPGDGSCVTAGGVCTLRAAVQQANASGSSFTCIALAADSYVLNLTGTVPEDSAATGDLDIKSNMVITGLGAAHTSVFGPLNDRVFQVFQVDSLGAGIAAAFADLYIQGRASVNDGAGISNSGNLLIERCVMQYSTATYGGAVFNQGDAVINDSEIRDNTAAMGGGIYSKFGKLLLRNSTVAANTATDVGGGINVYYPGSSLEVLNSTFSGNSAGPGTRPGGAINAENGTTVTIQSSTIAFNSAAGGGAAVNLVAAATGKITNSIIAGNTGGDCGGVLTSTGHNLLQSAGCGFAATGDITGVNPQLGALNDNGGHTRTHALNADSPAIDAGVMSTGTPEFDQTGVYRPQGTAVDIGAYEYRVAWPARIAGPLPLYYQDIQKAYDATLTGDTVELLNTGFTQEVSFNRSVAVTISGGYLPNFQSPTTFTPITGTVTVYSGTVTVENLWIY